MEIGTKSLGRSGATARHSSFPTPGTEALSPWVHRRRRALGSMYMCTCPCMPSRVEEHGA